MSPKGAELRVGFALDGILAPLPTPPSKAWRLCNSRERQGRKGYLLAHAKRVKPMYEPAGEFWVVTNRRNDPRTEEVTAEWLGRYFPGCKGVRFLDRALTYANSVEFKAAFIRDLRLDAYYDPDPSVVRRLKARFPEVRVVHFDPELIVAGGGSLSALDLTQADLEAALAGYYAKARERRRALRRRRRKAAAAALVLKKAQKTR